MWKIIQIVTGIWFIERLFSQKTPTVNPPATVTAATITLGNSIPVLFGTRDINTPNVTWYGDIATAAVKQKGGKK